MIVLTFAVTAGAASRIFTFANGILFDSLPYTNPARLVAVVSPLVTVTERAPLGRQQQSHAMRTLPCAASPQAATDHGLRRPKEKSSS